MGPPNETLGIFEKSQIRLLHADDTSNFDKLHDSVLGTVKVLWLDSGHPLAISCRCSPAPVLPHQRCGNRGSPSTCEKKSQFLVFRGLLSCVPTS